MNFVRLLARVGDIADAVTASADTCTRLCESGTRLANAGQREDAALLLAEAKGLHDANERALAVIRDIFQEIEREGVDAVMARE